VSAWLSVVIPTGGQRRDGLLRTIESIRRQPQADQLEVLVVADTYGFGNHLALEQLRDTVEACGARWLEHDAGLHCYGQPQRTFGSQHASGEWVAYSQDDNILGEDALGAIYRVVSTEPHKRPLFFRVQMYWGTTIWRDAALYQGNIDADCLVLPQPLASEIAWGLRYEGDLDAAVAAMQASAGDVGWREDVIALSRPEAVWWQ
jgi:hypothetical protein